MAKRKKKPVKKMKIEYSLVKGARIAVKPAIVGRCLEKIKRAHGGALTANAVVAHAVDKASPIHSEFEWDNDVAGHEYRVNQARYMIRSINVTMIESPDAEPTRAFVQMGEATEYRGIREVMADPLSREQLLDRAVRELESLKRRYCHLSELAIVFDAIDRMGEGLTG